MDKMQMINVVAMPAGVRRLGWRTIWGAMWALFIANRACRKTGTVVEVRVRLPIRYW